jgi:hypothetical protein
MSGTLQKIYRDNSWWAQRPDGTWMRWNDLDNTWVDAAPDFADEPSMRPPAPPPPPGAEAGRKVVDARVPEPDYVYTEYVRRPVWRDVMHVYVWLAAAAVILLGNMAMFFGPDLTSLVYGPPDFKEVLQGTYERPPSPYPMIAITLGVFGGALVLLVRRASEEWWQLQLLALGAVMSLVLTVVGIALGWQDGFEPLRALYYMTAFGAIGLGYVYYRSIRRI